MSRRRWEGKSVSGESKSCTLFFDDLVVGSFAYWRDLWQEGFHCLVLANSAPEPDPPNWKCQLIDGTGNKTERLQDCLAYVLGMWRRGLKVGVLCRSGANRSPAIAAGALYLAGRATSIYGAIEHFRAHRPEVGHYGGTTAEVERAAVKMANLTLKDESHPVKVTGQLLDALPGVQIQSHRATAIHHAESSMKALFRFTHGLGDSVQLTSVFAHLAKYRPDMELYLLALRGKHSSGRGHCKQIWHDQEPAPSVEEFQSFYDLGWWENYNSYTDCTNTKVTNCLREEFGITPDLTLLRYFLNPSEEDLLATEHYLKSIGCVKKPDGRYNAVILHYEGNTSCEKKNIGHDQALYICGTAIDMGCVPIILDWDRRSPLPDERRIFCPRVHSNDIWGGFGTGDSLRIAALIQQSSLFIGVDSGPQKCAGATDTPSIGIWTKHHPVQFIDLCQNFIHLIPSDWYKLPPCQNRGVAQFFVHHYKYKEYQPDRFEAVLEEQIVKILGGCRKMKNGLVSVGGFWVPEHHPEQSRVIVEDVYFNDCYRTYLRPPARFNDGEEYVVDIGANIGCFAKLWHERNPKAKIACVEICPEVLPALRENAGEYATIIPAACTYEQEVMLLDSFSLTASRSTGGSMLVTKEEYEKCEDPQYYKAGEVVHKVTLEEVMQQCGFPRIDFLKLDCEGSEFSILRNCDLSKVGTIFVESHGSQRWRELLAEKFKGWHVGHISANGNFENWHLVNPAWDI